MTDYRAIDMEKEFQDSVKKLFSYNRLAYNVGTISDMVSNVLYHTRMEASVAPTGWRTRKEFMSRAIRDYKKVHMAGGGGADIYTKAVHSKAVAHAIQAWEAHVKKMNSVKNDCEQTPEQRFHAYYEANGLDYTPKQVKQVLPIVLSYFQTPNFQEDSHTLQTIHDIFKSHTSSFRTSIIPYLMGGPGETSRRVLALWKKLSAEEQAMFLGSRGLPPSLLVPILLRITTL